MRIIQLAGFGVALLLLLEGTYHAVGAICLRQWVIDLARASDPAIVRECRRRQWSTGLQTVVGWLVYALVAWMAWSSPTR